jgi:hypothetical protein
MDISWRYCSRTARLLHILLLLLWEMVPGLLLLRGMATNTLLLQGLK